MGVSFFAWVKYDRGPAHDPSTLSKAPFSTEEGSFVDLADYDDLRAGHDNLFISAISGVRATGDFRPLYALRGLPPNIGQRLRKRVLEFFDVTYAGLGWLTLHEIRKAIHHASVPQDRLSLPVQLVLEMMSFLELKVGPGRVRLVFAIE